MTEWLTPGAIDWIVGGVVLELGLLGTLLVRASLSRLVLPLGLHLASGAALLVAVRQALAGSNPSWVALALLAGLVAHAASLWQTFRRLPRSPW